MRTWLKKWFRRDPKSQQERPGQIVTGAARLIALVDLSQSRRTRQALPGLKGLDPQTHSMLWQMQYLRDDEIRPPTKRWCDPV